jgi:hypothetical protein
MDAVRPALEAPVVVFGPASGGWTRTSTPNPIWLAGVLRRLLDALPLDHPDREYLRGELYQCRQSSGLV